MSHVVEHWANAIQQTWLFGQLPKEELIEIAKVSEEKVFGPGMPIIQEGKTGDSLWVIRSGKLKVFKLIPGHVAPGKEVTALWPGDMFAEQAWLDGFPSSASIITSEESSLVKIPYRALDSLLDKYRSAQIHILRKLAINLSQRLRG